MSGIIGALIAQSLEVVDAAKLGVHLHGAAADRLVQRGTGPVGVCASELAPEVRTLINDYNTSHTVSNPE